MMNSTETTVNQVVRGIKALTSDGLPVYTTVRQTLSEDDITGLPKTILPPPITAGEWVANVRPPGMTLGDLIRSILDDRQAE